MANTTHTEGYRLYWYTWLLLLILTLGMLVIDSTAWARWTLIALLLCGMLVKAGFIAGNFMHLRFERPVLILIVAGALLATSLAMFLFLAADALRILRLSSH